MTIAMPKGILLYFSECRRCGLSSRCQRERLDIFYENAPKLSLEFVQHFHCCVFLGNQLHLKLKSTDFILLPTGIFSPCFIRIFSLAGRPVPSPVEKCSQSRPAPGSQNPPTSSSRMSGASRHGRHGCSPVQCSVRSITV